MTRVIIFPVTIGSIQAGTLSVDSALTHTNDNLTLRSGEDIFVNASITTPQTLALIAGDDIIQGSGSLVTTNTFTVTVDTPDVDPAGGIAALHGAVTTTTNTLTGNNDVDTLSGSVAADILVGLGGNDVLQGGGGADIMQGGTGDDRRRWSEVTVGE